MNKRDAPMDTCWTIIRKWSLEKVKIGQVMTTHGVGFLNEMEISILIVRGLVLMNQNTIWIISITNVVPYDPISHNIIYVD